MNHRPNRARGTRGGRDQFDWDSVKADKYRQNYLGHSVHAPTGRWQKGKDLLWYTKKGQKRDSKTAHAAAAAASSSSSSSRAVPPEVVAEREAVKERERIARLKALGLPVPEPAVAPQESAKAEPVVAALNNAQLDEEKRQKMRDVLRRGQLGGDALETADRVSGLGFSEVGNRGGELALAPAEMGLDAPTTLEGTGEVPPRLESAGVVAPRAGPVQVREEDKSPAAIVAAAKAILERRKRRRSRSSSGSESGSESESDRRRKKRKRKKQKKKQKKKDKKKRKKKHHKHKHKKKHRRGRSSSSSSSSE